MNGQLTRPGREQCGRPIDGSNVLEVVGGACEVASAPAGEPLGIGCGARGLLRGLPSGFGQRIVNPDRMDATLDLSRIASSSRHSNAAPVSASVVSEAMIDAEILVRPLQPRCQVHRVAHHRIVETPPRTNVPDQSVS
jgi:hypothetical protein